MSIYDNAFNAIKFVFLNRLRYDIINILDDFQDLDLSKIKLVCKVEFKKRTITMNDFPVILRKKVVYLKITNIQDFLKVVKDNEMWSLELFDCKTVCTRKIFNHWDYPSIKLYNSCKCIEPKNNIYEVSWLDRH